MISNEKVNKKELLVKLGFKLIERMEDSDSTLKPQGPTEDNKQENNSEKKTVGQLFGIQLSAPEGMKNPLRIFLLLVIGNFLLLFLVAKALGLF